MSKYNFKVKDEEGDKEYFNDDFDDEDDKDVDDEEGY
jgi:hypothetical protein